MQFRLAAAALASALVFQGAPAVAAAWPTAEDCILYDAAFKAVVGEETPSTSPRRVAYTTREVPLGFQAGEPGLGAALNLKACIALSQRIYAAGMTFEGRPAFGFRFPGTPYYEHFSRTLTEDGKVRLTYWRSEVAWVNLTLSRGPGGGWTVESAREVTDPRCGRLMRGLGHRVPRACPAA